MLNVWLVKLEEKSDPAVRFACESALDAADRKRARFFRLEPARDQFILGRALGRLALSRCVAGLTPSQWKIDVSAAGKPTVKSGPAFNISHTDQLVACATLQGGAVGIDVQPLDLVFDLNKMSSALTGEELQRLSAMSEMDGCAEFARIWAAKEAAAKACGRGLSVGFQNVRLRATPDGYAVTGSAGDWTVWQTRVEPAHCLAIATAQPQSPMIRHLTLAELAAALTESK